jgi:hypothetical protein
MQAKLEKLNKPLPKVYAQYYGEDWKTQGDWVGRYGKQLSCLCAASSPFDHFVQSSYTIELQAFIGPNSFPDDTIRRWVHWLKTDNPKTLYSPMDGYRRQAEWDDHGEAYPMSMDGPDVWILLDIGEEESLVYSSLEDKTYELAYAGKITNISNRLAPYKATFYFFNKDGHEGMNRMRDYMIEIYPAEHDYVDAKDERQYAEYGESLARKMPPLAKARVKDFWGGVHKSFLLMGAGKYLVRIRRNYSFNTIVSSVCLDHYGKWTNSEDPEYPLELMYDVRVEPEPFPETFDHPLSEEAVHLWNLIEQKAGYVGSPKLAIPYRISAYHAATSAERSEPTSDSAKIVRKSLAWRLKQWNETERQIFTEKMAEAWKQFRSYNKNYIKQQEEWMRQREEGTWKDPWEGWD